MRYLSLGMGIILAINSFTVRAEDSNQNGYGASFGVGTGGGFSIKKTLGDTHHVFAGFNVSQSQHQSQDTFAGTTTNSDSSNHSYSIYAGIRHFLKKEKLSKFVQLAIAGNRATTSSNGLSSTGKFISILPGYGVEYFIAPDLSIEGVVGLGFHYSSGGSSSYNYTGKDLQLPTVGSAITYYW